MPQNKKYKRGGRRGRRRTYPKLYTAPIAKTHFAKLRWSEAHQVNATAGAAASQTFGANQLYEVTTSNVHQPRGFDQYMAMFNHWTVLGSKITATFYNEDATIPQLCFIILDGNSTATGGWQNVMEKQNVTSRLISGSASGEGKEVLSKKCSVKRELTKRNLIDEHDLRGSSSANCAEGLYFHCGAMAQDASSNPSTTTISVVIDYIVCFSEPASMNGS